MGQPDVAEDVHEESSSRRNSAAQEASTKVEEDDNDSISSWEKSSDVVDVSSAPDPPQVRPLGLSRRTGYSNFDDYDVVTVHGIRDDIQTAWTAPDDNSNWIQDKLFPNLPVRQLDYAYDASNSARIYDPSGNGINMEANALLDTLVKNRADLPSTEENRPIIWICHDLGGSIVKQALINAVHDQPNFEPDGQPNSEPDDQPDSDPDDQPDHEPDDQPRSPMRMRKLYRKLPLLTSTIIFLACPHGNESKEELEDQLFSLLCLPGPPVTTQISQKIANLSRQIERINLEFLETNVLDRAIILNITIGPNSTTQTDAAAAVETEHPTEDGQVIQPTAELSTAPVRLFSMSDSALLHNLGIYYVTTLEETDHLALVRGPDPNGAKPHDWATYYTDQFNIKLGHRIYNNYAYLIHQNSLLSLSPPTHVTKYRFYKEESSRPAFMSWLVEHEAHQRQIRRDTGSRTVYLHAGSRSSEGIDMKLVSQHLHVAYDSRKRDLDAFAPCLGCFYFEFDRRDSRRAGIRDMIASFVCTHACRFWSQEDTMLSWCSAHMAAFNSWSLKHLINVFLGVRGGWAVNDMTIILGQIDHCDEEERNIFIQAVLERQIHNDTPFNLVLTTTRPDGFLCEVLPPESVISLSDCPLSLDEYLAYPTKSGTAEDRMQRLLLRRPEFAVHGPQIQEIFGKFRKEDNLQDAVLEWLANFQRDAPTDKTEEIIQEASSDAHQRLLRSLIGQLPKEQRPIVILIYNWIKYAAEPLTLEILVEAIRCSLSQELAQLPEIQNDKENFSRLIEQSMRGVIMLEGRDLRFSDDAFYDVSATDKLCAEPDQTSHLHAEMSTVCLRYLLGREGQEMLDSLSTEKHGMEDVSWSPMALPRHSLVSYALRFWTTHYRAAGEYRPIDLAAELFRDKTKMRVWLEANYVVSNPFTRTQKDYLSPLPYMAMFGLDDLVRRHIEDEERHEGWNQDHWLAIAEAARNGHAETVTLLLQHSDTDPAGLREALSCAVKYGPGEALNCLLSTAQSLPGFQWPPGILRRAVVLGLENIVSAVLQTDYDVNEKEPTDKWTPNHEAVDFCEDRLLKMLLDSGRVDLGAQTQDGDTLITLAAFAGSPQSIRLLLDAGASLDDCEDVAGLLYKGVSQGNHWGLKAALDAGIFSDKHFSNPKYTGDGIAEPLLLAAHSGYRECTRVLLDNGADPNVVSKGATALCLAITSGPFPDLCDMLLEKGADPNLSATDDSDSDGKDVPLVRAISIGNKPLVSKLLDHGAEINATGLKTDRDDCETPLTWAIACRQPDIANLLLERGADPNLVAEDRETNWSPLLAAFFFSAEISFIEGLIKRDADIRWRRKDNGWTMLHAAYDNPETMTFLLKSGLDINATENAGWTTLMVAVAQGETKAVEFLLKQDSPKADLEVIGSEDDMDTALTLACKYGHGEIVKLLLEAGALVDHQRTDGAFPLGLLLASEDLPTTECEDIVTRMLKRGPNLSLADRDENTVLHRIRSDTPLPVVMRLVEGGAPVNAFNAEGYNPLARAVDCGNTGAARYLTTVKGVQTDVYHKRFGSILHMAAAGSTLEIVRQLVRTGAEHSVVDPEFGESVLYSAIGNSADKQGRRRIMRYLVEEAGVDVNARGGELVSPLLRVMREDTYSMVVWNDRNSLLKYLLRHGARVDQADSLGRTGVHWAAIHQCFDELKTLLRHGADPLAADNYGRTPLHYAAARGSRDTVEFILEKLPDAAAAVEATDVDGWTLLMWACRYGGGYATTPLIDDHKADVSVRSKDGKWSPLKIALYHGWNSYDPLDTLIPAVDAQGREKSWVAEHRETEPGMSRWRDCVGCELRIMGQAWICPTCERCLCFKCIPHSGTMHNPEHTFIDLDEYEKNQEGSQAGANQSEHGSDSGDKSNNEDQDEDESESEEEEEDDSD